MSCRIIFRDIGSLPQRGSDLRLSSHQRDKSSHGSLYNLNDRSMVIQSSCWAYLPLELLCDVIKRLEESESMWPARKHVVACASICKSWRSMCKDIVKGPKFCGKLTFPVSLKQPGPRDGMILCFIKRDKSNLHTIFIYALVLHC